MKKEIRIQVYEKYNGRCAYCGKEIKYKEMQVDHIIAKRLEHFSYQGLNGKSIDDISNLNPSCRRCNHYKRANTIELFRQYIQEIPRKLKLNYIYKVGLDYSIIQEFPKEVKFYFETIEEKQ